MGAKERRRGRQLDRQREDWRQQAEQARLRDPQAALDVESQVTTELSAEAIKSVAQIIWTSSAESAAQAILQFNLDSRALGKVVNLVRQSSRIDTEAFRQKMAAVMDIVNDVQGR